MVVATTSTKTPMDFITIHGHPSIAAPSISEKKQEEWLSICALPGKGRGFVATQQIPADTIVHTAEPLAAVVSQEWIPETCAWCFHFTYPKRMKYKLEMMIPTLPTQKKKRQQQQQYTSKDVLFCSASCQQKYKIHGYHKDESNLLLRCFHALEQQYHQREKKQQQNNHGGPVLVLSKDMHQLIDDLLLKVDVQNDDQLRHWTDQAWTTFVQQQQQQEETWMPDDAERTMLRLIASCIGRRQMETEYLFPELPVTVPTFNDLFHIQCNELAYIRRILLDENHAKKEKKIVLDSLFDIMQMYTFFISATSGILLDCPHTLFRAIYFREMSNSFGLWEIASKKQDNHGQKEDDAITDDLELLGYGIYPSAVYFNHACDANVRKVRKGRNMVFISKRVIEQGEEACISYGCVEDTVQERRKRLLDHYHFLCACTRCEQEASSLSS